MNRYLAVDIGGTRLRAACFPVEGLEPMRVARTPTRDPERKETPLERLISLIRSVWPEDGEVAVISVAAPGPVNPFTSTVLKAPNIPGWVDFPLKLRLEEYFDAQVILGNDANLAALGEWKYGAGKGHRNMVYLTVSTGIGGGIILNDCLYLGEQGLAGEIGHTTVIPGGPLCSCGQHGHLEAIASGTAIARWTQDKLAQGAASSLPADKPVSTRMIAEAARSGDKLSIAALERAGRYIGIALANLVHIINPGAIVIGGGVSQSGAFLFEPIRAALAEHIMNPNYMDELVLTRAAFGDEVGLIGALALGRTMIPPTPNEHE